MKVRVLVQPTGLLNGVAWPEVGGELELADATAEDMAGAGWVEIVKGPAKKAAAKVEKRPASKAGVEERGE